MTDFPFHKTNQIFLKFYSDSEWKTAGISYMRRIPFSTLFGNLVLFCVIAIEIDYWEEIIDNPFEQGIVSFDKNGEFLQMQH